PVSDEIWATYIDRWVKVGAFNVHQNRRQYGPDKPFEGGRWIADKQDKDGTVWLDVDFGHDHTYNQAVIYTNRYWKRVREFELHFGLMFCSCYPYRDHAEKHDDDK
ncbi:unnamed protein product, partial [marine sediment metagenome]